MNEKIIEETKKLIEMGCCPELSEAAKAFLAAQGTDKLEEATNNYKKELANGVVTIDQLLTLFQMDQFKAQVGEEQAATLFNEFTKQKAAGQTRCQCQACNKAVEILGMF